VFASSMSGRVLGPASRKRSLVQSRCLDKRKQISNRRFYSCAKFVSREFNRFRETKIQRTPKPLMELTLGQHHWKFLAVTHTTMPARNAKMNHKRTDSCLFERAEADGRTIMADLFLPSPLRLFPIGVLSVCPPKFSST